jgi:hypothetical protein
LAKRRGLFVVWRSRTYGQPSIFLPYCSFCFMHPMWLHRVVAFTNTCMQFCWNVSHLEGVIYNHKTHLRSFPLPRCCGLPRTRFSKQSWTLFLIGVLYKVVNCDVFHNGSWWCHRNNVRKFPKIVNNILSFVSYHHYHGRLTTMCRH